MYFNFQVLENSELSPIRSSAHRFEHAFTATTLCTDAFMLPGILSGCACGVAFGSCLALLSNNTQAATAIKIPCLRPSQLERLDCCHSLAI